MKRKDFAWKLSKNVKKCGRMGGLPNVVLERERGRQRECVKVEDEFGRKGRVTTIKTLDLNR